MRVTNQMMANNALSSLNSLRSRLDKVQNQITTGRRIDRASEDPTAGAEVMRVQSRLQQLDQWDKNLGDARTWTGDTEQALSHMTDILKKAKELAVRGNNSHLDTDDKAAIAIEVDHLLQDMMAAVNTKQLDGALFGGFETAADPFALDMATGAVTYSGDNGDIRREVGPGVNLTVNVHGNRLGDWSAPQNMLTTLWRLRESLNGNSGGIVPANSGDLLNDLDNNLQNVLNLRADIGAADQRLEAVETRMKETLVRATDVLTQAQGVDMEKAIIELNSAETTYRAALQVGARILPPTLADFLG